MVSLSHGNDSLLLQSVFIVLVHALSLLSICFHAFIFLFSSSHLDFCWLAGHGDGDKWVGRCGAWRERELTVLLVPYCLVQGVVFSCSCSA